MKTLFRNSLNQLKSFSQNFILANIRTHKTVVLSLVICSSLFLVSCGDDDDNSPELPPGENGFSLNGSFFTTDQLAFLSLGTGDTALIVFGGGELDQFFDFVGESLDIVFLNFQFDSGIIPPTDIYTHNVDNETLETFFAELSVDLNPETGEGFTVNSTGGTVNLEFNPDTEVYTLDYTVETSQGTINGFYQGDVDTFID